MTIDKIMISGGPETKQMDMQKFIQMADKEKIEFDMQQELFRAIEDKFKEQRKPGESFDSWLNRTPVEELKRIELKKGGRIGFKDGNGVADKDSEKAALGKRVRELMDEGFEMGEAVRKAMSEGYANGGRIGKGKK